MKSLVKFFLIAGIGFFISSCSVSKIPVRDKIERDVVLSEPGKRAILQVLPTPTKLVAVLSSDSVFKNNTANFNKKAFIHLNQILQLINNNPQTHHIEIIAYSDNILVNNDFNNNTLLQANNIAAYFWDHGVPHNMISAKAKFSKNSVSNNQDIVGRADNRRVEVSLVYNTTPPLV